MLLHVCYVCYTDYGMILAIKDSVPGEFRSKLGKNTPSYGAKLVEGELLTTMLRVLIVCSWGMSTSMLVDSMLEAAAAAQYELQVEALSAGEYAAKVDDCDVVLIAPQIRHLRKSIEKLALSVGKPVAMIEPFYYATMNGQAVLKQVLSLVTNTQKDDEQT